MDIKILLSSGLDTFFSSYEKDCCIKTDGMTQAELVADGTIKIIKLLTLSELLFDEK